MAGGISSSSCNTILNFIFSDVMTMTVTNVLLTTTVIQLNIHDIRVYARQSYLITVQVYVRRL